MFKIAFLCHPGDFSEYPPSPIGLFFSMHYFIRVPKKTKNIFLENLARCTKKTQYDQKLQNYCTLMVKSDSNNNISWHSKELYIVECLKNKHNCVFRILSGYWKHSTNGQTNTKKLRFKLYLIGTNVFHYMILIFIFIFTKWILQELKLLLISYPPFIRL